MDDVGYSMDEFVLVDAIWNLIGRRTSFTSIFDSRFNRRVQIHHSNNCSFIELLQKEEVRFHHMNTQFNSGLAARKNKSQQLLFKIVYILFIDDIMMG
jgi:hypothetical protein